MFERNSFFSRLVDTGTLSSVRAISLKGAKLVLYFSELLERYQLCITQTTFVTGSRWSLPALYCVLLDLLDSDFHIHRLNSINNSLRRFAYRLYDKNELSNVGEVLTFISNHSLFVKFNRSNLKHASVGDAHTGFSKCFTSYSIQIKPRTIDTFALFSYPNVRDLENYNNVFSF